MTLSQKDKDEISATIDGSGQAAALALVTAQLTEQTAKRLRASGLGAGFKSAQNWSVEAETVIKTCDAKIAAAEARVAAGAGSAGPTVRSQFVMRTVGPPIIRPTAFSSPPLPTPRPSDSDRRPWCGSQVNCPNNSQMRCHGGWGIGPADLGDMGAWGPASE
eukprot:gene12975-biopygen6980